MAISSNYVPEKINEFNAYLDGDKMIGVASSITLPEISQKSSTISAAGILGEIDSPTVGQFESMEQEIQFNTLYSSAMDLFALNDTINITFRAAQQIYDKTGGYAFKGVKIVEQGRVKKINPGKLEKGETQDVTVTLELTVLEIYEDDEELFYLDKLNGIFRGNGEDLSADISNLI